MPDEHRMEETLTAPLAALEDVIRAPEEALREGVQQLDQTTQRSGLPKLPDPPGPPNVFRRRSIAAADGLGDELLG